LCAETFSLLPLLVWSAFITGATAWAEPIAFDVPAQSADTALLAVSRQAHIEVLFSFDDLHQKTSSAVVGNLEPEAALARRCRARVTPCTPRALESLRSPAPASPPRRSLAGWSDRRHRRARRARHDSRRPLVGAHR